jgi:hypothetical protein
MVVRWKVIPNVGINLLQNDCYLLGLERLQVGRDIERENRTCRMKKRTQAEVPYYHMPDIQLINCFRSIDLRSLLFVVCSQQGSALVKYGVGRPAVASTRHYDGSCTTKFVCQTL